MTLDAQNPRVQELIEVRDKAIKELAEIRSKCSHERYYLGLWSWRVGCVDPARLCVDCHDCIEYVPFGHPEYDLAKIKNTVEFKKHEKNVNKEKEVK